MEKINIYNIDGELVISVTPSDSSKRVRRIMSDNTLELNFSLIQYIEIPIYSYVYFQGEKYTLWRPENITKHAYRNHEYTIVFGSDAGLLKKYKYKSLADIPFELKFSITAKPAVLLQLLVDNINLYNTGWSVGDCIDAPEKLFAVNHEYCYDMLHRIAQEFNTEWEVTDKVIHLRKVEYFKTEPAALSYGRGNGFRPGVKRQNSGNKLPTTILYVQGGERNIEYAKYGSKTLLLPKNASLEYEGRSYKTDEYGMSITRADRELTAYNEDSYDASDIYPSRVGEVTEVIKVGKEDHIYDFTDTSIPADLDFEECLIPDNVSMSVIFQSGALTGREFDVRYIHASRRFEIMPAKMDGFDMPSESFKPSPGDKYAVFNVMLPEAYICDNETKTGASWDMFREAVRYMYAEEEEQFAFSGEIDPIWSQTRWLEVGIKLKPGGYVAFSDQQFQQEPVLVRITGVTDYLNRPYGPQVDFSNATAGYPLWAEMGRLSAEEVVNEARHKEAIRYSSLRWRDTVELDRRLQDSLLNFSGAINPITVHAMMEYLGDESLQFRWVDDKVAPEEIDHNFAYNAQTKIFSSPAGIIQHMTLGIDSLAPGHAPSQYKFWDIASYTSPALDGLGPLWLYLKCEKDGTNGTLLFSADAIEMDAVAGYYHFLTGHLNNEFEGERNFVTLYGFSMWTPGAMRVNKVVSTDGSQFWDMLNKRFRIGSNSSYISYNADEAERLVLKGTLVQSQSGALDDLGIDRGNYVSGATYYPGDMVKYTDGNIYKCLQQTTAAPTNATYWKLSLSKGDTGAKGTGYKYAYYPSNSLTPPSAPPTPGSIPSGWYSYPDFKGYRYIYVSQCIETAGAWGGWTTPTIYSVIPEDGDPGPAIVFRGEFSSGNTYYNNAARRDVVKYGETYYIYAGANNAGGAWSSGNWDNFGAQFSSVATDLLLALNANIGGWIFRNERLESQSGGAYLDGRNGTVAITGKLSTGVAGEDRIEIDPSTRSVRMLKGDDRSVAELGFDEEGIPRLQLWEDGSGAGVKAIITPSGITMESGRAFGVVAQFTEGSIKMSGLPTSSDGLSLGTFYRDGNTIKIV